ncbi:hypothetical protein WME99_45210 [Sorangium sp. So ce136]|uniref:hypothetical protein n=1 Tax=Sorangium sp. So ce136 TaxID=3133284 RepID=UPI003F0928B7
MTSTGALAAAPGEALSVDRGAALTGPPASSTWGSVVGLTLGAGDAGDAGDRELG